jgi:hypothetical protein
MSSASTNSSRSNRLWTILLVALALLSFLAMRRSMGRAMGMRAETTVGASPVQFKVGDERKVVMEVTSVVPAASIEGNVVEKQTETVYRRSGNRIKIAFDAATPVLMGKVSDVHERRGDPRHR